MSWIPQIDLDLYILPVAPIIHKDTEKQNGRYKPLRIYLKRQVIHI